MAPILGSLTSSRAFGFSSLTRVIRRLGLVNLSFNENDDATHFSNFSRGSVVQPDGKIIVFGSFDGFQGIPSSGIVRLNSDFSIDQAFSENLGTGLENSFGRPNPHSAEVLDVKLQPDGKIVLFGRFSHFINNSNANGIARLNPDGTLDQSFMSNVGSGVGGVAVVHKGAIQPDGKIILAGAFSSYNGVNVPSNLLRLNSNGTLDSSFSSNLGTGTNGFNHPVDALGLLSNGQIVVGGRFWELNRVNLGTSQYLTKINSNGTRDTSFLPNLQFTTPSTDEGATTEFYFWPYIDHITITPDDKILIAGEFARINNVVRQRVARLNSNGTLDTSFNPPLWSNLGYLQGGFEDSYGDPDDSNYKPAGYYTRLRIKAQDIKLASNGQIFIFWNSAPFNGANMGPQPITRMPVLNSDGTLNRYLNSEPRIFGGGSLSFTILPNTNILFSGTANQPQFLTLRNSFGDAVTAWPHTPKPIGSGISMPTASSPYSSRIRRAVGSGFFISTEAGGIRYNNGNSLANILKITESGTPDLSFRPVEVINASVRNILPQNDGKLLAMFDTGTSVKDGNTTLAIPGGLARFNLDGTPDYQFISNSANALSSLSYWFVDRAMGLQADGKVLIAYRSGTQTNILRLNSDGTIDNSFTRIDLGNSISINDIAVETNGGILIGGRTNINGNFGFTRLLPNGNLDASLFNIGVSQEVMSVAIQSDGKIVLGCRFNRTQLSPRASLVRLNSNYSLDTSFASNLGQMEGDEPANSNADQTGTWDLAIDSQNRIIIATNARKINGVSSFGIYRINSNGSVDNSFVFGKSVLGAQVGVPISSVSLNSNNDVFVVGGFRAIGRVIRSGIANLLAS